MRKAWVLILSALLLGACLREEPLQEERPVAQAEPENTVTIRFSVPWPYSTAPETKTPGEYILQETMDMETLHLAVFGSSGYLKEYVMAENLGKKSEPYEYHYSTWTRDEQGNEVEHPGQIAYVDQYEFMATLTLTDKRRVIHFVGNGPETLPFGLANSILPPVLSRNPGQGSFWQILEMNDGIQAARDANGDLLLDANGHYVPDDATLSAFREIPLIRNWSKIVLTATEDSNFTPISFAVINVPSKGTVAPYDGSIGFVTRYQEKSFPNLMSMGYEGNLPANVTFDTSIPAESEFEDPSTSLRVGDPFSDQPDKRFVYLYERPAPTSQIPPTYVIIYGHYRNMDDDPDPDRPGMRVTEGDYYYKVDLMEDGSYYPIFRNFKYEIQVKKISAPGQATPADAAVSAGSADVSSDVNTQNLVDISDGISRLALDPWISQTFTDPQTDNTTLSVKFFADASSNTPDDGSSIELELRPMADPTAPDLITDYHLCPELADDGWIPISFSTRDEIPTTIQSQVIRVKGRHPGMTGSYIYRDVEITVQPIQEMIVQCAQERILAHKGTPLEVDISIPEGLHQSMFPLEFTIEAQDMTLEPDNSKPNNNLPIVSGKSFSEDPNYTGKSAFQFVRTLTWEEYRTLAPYRDVDNSLWRVIPCYFRSNQDASATTIWVKNRYFNKQGSSFRNYGIKQFQNMSFTSSIPMASDRTISVHFDLEVDDYLMAQGLYPQILLTVQGMRPAWEGVTNGPSPGTYYFTPNGTSVTLPFTTLNEEGEVHLAVSADEYEPNEVVAGHFQMVGMKDAIASYLYGNNAWSNVAFGFVTSNGNKNAVFGYADDPRAETIHTLLNAPVSLVDAEGTPLTNTANKSGLYVEKSKYPSFPWTPTGPRSANGLLTYHEICLKTSTGAALTGKPIDFYLTAPGYVEEHIHNPRFTVVKSGGVDVSGRIHTVRITDSTLGNAGIDAGNTVYTYYDNSDFGHFQIRFEVLEGSAITSSSTSPVGLVLPAGSKCRMHVKTVTDSGRYPAQRLFFVDFYTRRNAKWNGVSRDLKPVSVTVPAGQGTCEPYAGGYEQYVWSVPYDVAGTDFYVDIQASPDYPTNISTLVLKSYTGDLTF